MLEQQRAIGVIYSSYLYKQLIKVICCNNYFQVIAAVGVG